MAIYVFGALLWTFLGTADVQPWDTYWIKDENKNTCKQNRLKYNTYSVIFIYIFSLDIKCLIYDAICICLI